MANISLLHKQCVGKQGNKIAVTITSPNINPRAGGFHQHVSYQLSVPFPLVFISVVGEPTSRMHSLNIHVM
jgi:hypothetical protein